MTRPLPEPSVGEAVMAALEEWDYFTVDGENYDRLVAAMDTLRTAVALAVTRAT